jgi:hypothetical protein
MVAILPLWPFLALLLAGCAARSPLSPGCEAAGYRQLDFRIGTFDVFTAEGVPAGTSMVRPVAGGCALEERWKGAIAGTGWAYYAYDPGPGQWFLFFFDDAGNTLRLVGSTVGQDVVFEGDARFDVFSGSHRMVWSRQPSGDVRQFWEYSTDQGEHWTTVLDGRHRRRH